MSDKPNTPTKAWYLVPIFFGIIGGIIMYFAVKPQDQQMANNGLILGIVLQIGVVLFYVGMLAAMVAYE